MVIESLHIHASTKLKDALYTFICTHVANSRVSVSVQGCDRDGDGVLSRDDLLPHFSEDRSPEAAAELLDRVMRQVDTDSNGFIDYTEFIKANIDREILLSRSNLQLAFSFFDKYGAGFITVEELKEWMGNGTLEDDERWVQLLNDAGLKGDGHIDLAVFEKLITEDLEKASIETSDEL